MSNIGIFQRGVFKGVLYKGGIFTRFMEEKVARGAYYNAHGALLIA
jgi:hypothetical protein